MKVGFIGLGSMGAPMAKNLVAAGFDVAVFDIEPSREAPFRESNVAVAPSGEALAAQTDVLLTSLPGPKQSRVAMSPLLAAMKPGTLWIDLTTNDRALLQTLAGIATGELRLVATG